MDFTIFVNFQFHVAYTTGMSLRELKEPTAQQLWRTGPTTIKIVRSFNRPGNLSPTVMSTTHETPCISKR